MNNTLVTVAVVVVLVLGGFFLFQKRGVAPIDNLNLDPTVQVDTTMPVPGSEVEETLVVKEFSVDAAPFSFTPLTMTVKNVKGTHDLKIDEFNAATRTLNAGETQTISFVADKVGTFEYYCSVGNHRAMGMVGSFIVR